MDNLTHSMVGWALAQTGLKRKTRKGLAALILGANMPDIDVFFGWVPWEPLATHRGFTHGLVGGVLLMPPMLAGLLWLLDKWQQRRGEVITTGLAMHFGWLVALSYIGAISHPLMDWQNTYAVQLLSPFDDRWFHNDALFIIDVWVLSGLGFALWLSRRRERAGRAWRRPAQVGLAALIAYITANGAISEAARQAPRQDEPNANPQVVFAGPPPVLFWQRDVVWRENGKVAWGGASPLVRSGLTRYSAPVPDNLDQAIVRQALASPEAKSFARWSVLPFAVVQPGRCSTRVAFGDARYGRSTTDNRLGTTVNLPTGAC